MSKVVQLLYKPRKQFSEFHKRSKRWSCIVAHRRAGKTVACINELIERALYNNRKEPFPKYAYVAPFYSQAKQIAWEYLKYYSRPISKSISESELSVQLINGAKVRLYGADNSDAVRGIYLDGCILDEPADMRPRFWGEVIRPTLSDYNGWAVFIGTPRGHNHFYDIYKQSISDNSWYSLILRASNTNILPEQELISAMATMTQDQYNQEYECSFNAAILGSYYGIEIRSLEDNGRITNNVEYDVTRPVFTAWDLGRTDDTVIWFYQVVFNEIRIIDFYSDNGKDVKHYAEVLLNKAYKYAIHYLPHDAKAKTLSSGGRSVIEQLASFLNISSIRIVPNLSLQDGIQSVRMMLPKCWFNASKCMNGIECLKQYQREYDQDKKIFKDSPRHDWTSHAADAFRMLAVSYLDEKKPVMLNKPKFFQDLTLDELWEQTPKTSKRI